MFGELKSSHPLRWPYTLEMNSEISAKEAWKVRAVMFLTAKVEDSSEQSNTHSYPSIIMREDHFNILVDLSYSIISYLFKGTGEVNFILKLLKCK